MKKVDVIIVGAGASGLYLGHKLLKADVDFYLLDKAVTSGGVIQEDSFSGYKVPFGPRVFLAKRGALLKQLAQEFDEPILEHSRSLTRYILGKKGLYRLSMGVFLKHPLGILKYLLKKPLKTEETIASYFSALVGKQFVEDIIDPMSFGIWAQSPCYLSMDVLMTDMKQKRLFGKKGPKGLIAFPNGLKSLFLKIEKSLQERFFPNTEVAYYEVADEGIRVVTNRGVFLTKKLVIATSFCDMQQLIKDKNLETLKAASLDVVTFCFDKKQHRVHGSGYLIPTKEGFKTKGVLFDADLLGYADIDMLSSFIQNACDPAKQAYEELKQVLPELNEPSCVFVNSYKESIFTCDVGSSDKISQLEAGLNKDHIYLLGAYPRVGLYDCLQKADKLAETFYRFFTGVLSNKP